MARFFEIRVAVPYLPGMVVSAVRKCLLTHSSARIPARVQSSPRFLESPCGPEISCSRITELAEELYGGSDNLSCICRNAAIPRCRAKGAIKSIFHVKRLRVSPGIKGCTGVDVVAMNVESQFPKAGSGLLVCCQEEEWKQNGPPVEANMVPSAKDTGLEAGRCKQDIVLVSMFETEVVVPMKLASGIIFLKHG